MQNFRSWGNHPQTQHEVKPIYWSNYPYNFDSSKKSFLPFGKGRSYGDSCLNDEGILIPTHYLNKFIYFDKINGILKCESGTTLEEILNLIIPHGWFLPVTPGTKFITIGGAIANDVHGKNHHKAGTFGCHVNKFELLRSNNERILCSPEENTEWFNATIGGLGLTGIILWAEFKLQSIQSPFIDAENIKFKNFEEFFDIAENSDQDFEHTVAWIDCLSKGASLGRGIFMRGNYANIKANHLSKPKDYICTIPCSAPNFFLNQYSIKAFNSLYYHKQRQNFTSDILHFNPFFYPLDIINNWNKIYGKRGFFQYQCVVPFESTLRPIQNILELISNSNMGSFLAILKVFGENKSPGLMSFPKKGVTLALDFANCGDKTLQLFDQLDLIIKKHNGSIYPAKDARMSEENFKLFYPNWKTFEQYIDPKFSSSFWRRINKQNSNLKNKNS